MAPTALLTRIPPSRSGDREDDDDDRVGRAPAPAPAPCDQQRKRPIIDRTKEKKMNEGLSSSDAAIGADEVSASVEMALSAWKSAFDDPPSSFSPKRRKTMSGGTDDRTCAGEAAVLAPSSGDDTPATTARAKADTLRRRSASVDEANDDDSTYLGPEAYRRRLGTFRPETYFAKPLALSPLICAAFGWENRGRDLLRCSHPRCGAAVCISFPHPGCLDRASFDGLTRTYLVMLASSHAGRGRYKAACPFRSYAERWSKSAVAAASPSSSSIAKKGFYVPPHLLSLSDEFLRFEDGSDDGSLTRDIVTRASLLVRDGLRSVCDSNGAGVGRWSVDIPEEMAAYARELLPGEDDNCDAAVTVLYDGIGDGICDGRDNDGATKTALLLSTFGWSFCNEERRGGCTVECRLCLAQAVLSTPIATAGAAGGSKLKRKAAGADHAAVRLIGSHRAHCPYSTGFAIEAVAPGSKPPPLSSSQPGWRVVLSNLAKYRRVRGMEAKGDDDRVLVGAKETDISTRSLRVKIRAS